MPLKLFPRLIPASGRLLMAALIIICCFSSCKWWFKPGEVKPKELVSKMSWNVLFKPGINPAQRQAAIDAIRDSLVNYYEINYPLIKLKFDFSLYCICDSSLYNLNLQFIDGMGQSVSSPPPPPPGPSGSGDFVDVLLLANNSFISDTLDVDSLPVFTGLPVEISPRRSIKPGAVLAVIDTGIDTTLYTREIGNLIWRKEGANITFFNFLPFAPVGNLFDDHLYKHGSAVTALALQNLRSSTDYPKIMVLKALDEKKRGSSFTVSCAMSYAIQNNVTLINASLGYYGIPDLVLKHYIEEAAKHSPEPIPVFVAAGNVEDQHFPSNYCTNVSTNANELGVSKFFFPACFSTEYRNVVTVTNLNQFFGPCFYQNYSKVYVTLGVVGPVCCQHNVTFMSKAYEGSSFATPAASGIMIDCIIRNNFNKVAIENDWTTNILKQYAGIPATTVKRNYIITQ